MKTLILLCLLFPGVAFSGSPTLCAAQSKMAGTVYEFFKLGYSLEDAKGILGDKIKNPEVYLVTILTYKYYNKIPKDRLVRVIYNQCIGEVKF